MEVLGKAQAGSETMLPVNLETLIMSESQYRFGKLEVDVGCRDM